MSRQSSFTSDHFLGGVFSTSRSSQSEAFTFLVIFREGKIFAQPLNRRMTKREVAEILKTTEDGVAYLAKKGWLKPLGHPDESKQKLFSSSELYSQMMDSRSLGKATDLLYQFAEEKNASQARRKKKSL